MSVFVIVFAAVLRFTDTYNVQQQLLATSYLVVGRNPYSALPFPAPPGLFLAFLPSFAGYLLGGYSLVAATFVLKLENLSALLVATLVLTRAARTLGAPGASVRPLKLTFLLSPLLFFVSFVWVEQDILGIALALTGLGLVLSGSGLPARRGEEALGFLLLAFSVFVYYFPALLLPSLLVYSRNRSELARRVLLIGASLAAFALWFLILPGWDVLSNALGATGGTSVSIFSPFVLFSPQLFVSPTAGQLELVHAGTIAFFVGEVVTPLLLRWRGVALTTSVAVAMILPFLLLNLVNGDEYVWPFPFVLLALVSSSPGVLSGWRLAAVQAYAVPMVVVTNLFDAPGPGAGTGIFYFGYSQFHRATALGNLLSDPLGVAQGLAVLSIVGWVGLLAALALVDRSGRRANSSTTGALERDSAGPPTPAEGAGPTAIPAAFDVGGIGGTLRRLRRRRWTLAVLTVALVVTLLAVGLPATELSVGPGNPFPVGFFSSYAVANGSLTYGFGAGGTVVGIAPSLGTGPLSGAPGNLLPFSRNVSGERFSLNVTVGISAPTGIPYNTTILEMGNGSFAVTRPFLTVPNSTLLVPLAEVNASPAGPISSPQFVGPLSGARTYVGSSYTEYTNSSLGVSGSQVTLWFRATDTALSQSIVAAVYDAGLTYELFGVGDQFILGYLPNASAGWVFSTPQRVDTSSWHGLTITHAASDFVFSLDGATISEATPMPAPSGPVTLFVGALSPDPAYFDRYAFIGSIAGPFNTTGASPGYGDPLVCPDGFSLSNGSIPGCVPFSPTPFSIQSLGGSGIEVDYGATAYRTELSSAAVVSFGRLSPLGPGLEFQVLSFSTTTSHGTLPLVWTADGSMIAPVWMGAMALRRVREDPPDHARAPSP